MGKGNDPNCMLGAAVGGMHATAMDAADLEVLAEKVETVEVEDVDTQIAEDGPFKGWPVDGEGYPVLPQSWNSDKLNISYVDTPEALAECVAALNHPQVTRVALDIETTGGLKPWYGSTRLIQLGVELPEPKQFLIDCWEVDPAAVFPVLEDPQVEIITCNGKYEQTWLHYRYGLVLTNLYDVCYASKAITKQKADATRARVKEQIKRIEAPYKERLKAIKKQLRAAVKAEDSAAEAMFAAQVAEAEAELEVATKSAKEAAAKPRKISSDFRRLMRRYVNKQISKAQQTSAWDDPELNEAQRKYAAMDVAGLLDIRRGIGADVLERDLQDAVGVENRKVLDSTLRELRHADLRASQFAKLARSMLHCRTVEQLDRLFKLQGQVTLHHSFRPKLHRIYEQQRAKMLNA